MWKNKVESDGPQIDKMVHGHCMLGN